MEEANFWTLLEFGLRVRDDLRKIEGRCFEVYKSNNITLHSIIQLKVKLG